MRHGDCILNDTPMGIIVPPPEIRKIIDKAAELVGRYGSSIEATIQNEEKNLPKFSFLREGDPYRPYYLQKAKENAKATIKIPSGQTQNLNEMDNEKFLGRKTGYNTIKREDEDKKSNYNTSGLNTSDGINKSKKSLQIQDELRKIIEEKKMNKFMSYEIKPPLKDQFSISHPNISSIDMDVIKITAQFVARNGQKFLTGLSEREIRNPQFDFLKPQHNLFGYFTYLVESYAKCLRKDENFWNKANLYLNDRESIFKKATERYLWEKKQKEILKKKDAVDENERNQMAQIDWFDFAIVEVIDFTEEELFNTVPILDENDTTVNMNINSIQANVDILMKMNNLNNKSIPIQFEEEKILDDTEYKNNTQNISQIDNLSQNIEIIPTEDVPEPGMKIVKNYKRKAPENINAKKDQVKCPLCKESILIDDWPQHIKIELLDPKWREIQKELSERKIEMSLAPNSDFVNYLSEFSRYRPDLFGDVKDVVKIEEKKKSDAKVPGAIWDGIAPNISRTTANIAMLFQQNRKNIEESIKAEGGQSGSRVNVQSNMMNISSTQQGDGGNRYIANQSNINISQGNINVNAIPLYVSKQTPKLNITSENSNLNSQNSIIDTRIPSINPSNNTYGNIAKSESKLIPEEIFLMKNNKPIKLNIKLPVRQDVSKNYRGQIITVTVDPSDKILNLKSKLKRDLGDNSGNRFDSSITEFILKTLNDSELEDDRSFAFYNLTNNSFIELDV